MPDDKPKLIPIDGGRISEKPRAGKRESLTDSEQITCGPCLAAHGVETSSVVAVTIAPRRDARGNLTSGRKIWACAYCLARGEITELAEQ